MGKAATSEPSMDEILSSIRQIISEDDVENEAGDSNADSSSDSAEVLNEEDNALSADIDLAESGLEELQAQDDVEDIALALSAEQIVPDEVEIVESVAQNEDESLMVMPDDIDFEDEGEDQVDEPIVDAKTLPDPDLSDDIADKLLEPATDAAVASAFSQLGSLGISSKDATVESMIREMLRPMLKGWLDENLPTVVENMVRKEIERLSRGS